MTKRFPNIGRVFIVLTAITVLLTGWDQPAAGQTEPSTKADPPGVASKTANNIQEPSEGSPPGPHSSPEDTLAMPSEAAGKWAERYETLAAGIHEKTLDPEDANKFYQELNTALREKRDHLGNALSNLTSAYSQRGKIIHKKAPSESSRKAPGEQESRIATPSAEEAGASDPGLQIAEQLQSELTVLYDLRIQVLQELSPAFRSRMTGTGVDGIQALKEELDYILLKFRYRLNVLPKLGRRAVNSMLGAAIPVLLLIIQLTIAFYAFFWWRRWATKGIPGLRTKILDINRRKSINKWLAKFLWYLNRVRSPLEWGLLLSIFVTIIDTSEGQVIHSLLWTKVKWVLTAWFAVVLVDAMSTRGAGGARSNTARLRMRSIWLLAIWVLVITIGLGITADIAGKGTIYEWVRIFSKLLAIPVLLLLIWWWRPEIYRMLEEESHQSAYIQKILKYKRGLKSYFGAVFGAVYLITNNFRQWVLRGITAFEGGRALIANLTRLEAMRVSERQRQRRQGEPISEEKRERLFEDNGQLVESVGDSSLERMIHLVEHRQRGAAALIAERGGGKTQLLKRLDSRIEDKTVLFSCPIGGFAAFQNVFAESLDLNASNLTPESITERLQETQVRVICIDNLDRLSRPTLGGQKDMDQMAMLIRALNVNVFSFFGVEWAAWQYLSSVRASDLFLDDVLMLSPWTEAQIMQLVELRSSHAGIVPDFGELSLPRQFEDINYETVEERNRFGFYRILWNASDGNPMVALQLWADSLRVAPDGRFLVSLPQLPATSELENVHITVLLTLRVIAQSGMANQEEIIASLRFQETEIAGALRFAVDRQWVESVNGSYRITRKWFRSITRVLARQNLLVRRTLGG